MRVRIDGEIFLFRATELDKNKAHNIEIVVDRLVVKNLQKLYKELTVVTKLNCQILILVDLLTRLKCH